MDAAAMPTAHQMMMQGAIAEGYTNPSLRAGDVCFRRCATNFKHEPTLEMGEKACMNRCVRKFYEAYAVTLDTRQGVLNKIKEERYPDAQRLVGDAAAIIEAAKRR